MYIMNYWTTWGKVTREYVTFEAMKEGYINEVIETSRWIAHCEIIKDDGTCYSWSSKPNLWAELWGGKENIPYAK